MRGGDPIEKATFRSKIVNAGITHSDKFLEWEACIAARLDINKWENGEYDRKIMAGAVAWYVDHLLVEQHNADAANSTR